MAIETKEEDDSEVRQRSQIQQFWRQYRQNTLSIIGGLIIVAMVLIALGAPFIAPQDPYQQFDPPQDQFHPVSPGTTVYTDQTGDARTEVTAYLGTDNVGRDILSRIIYGTRTTLLVAFSVVTFALLIGAVLGAVSGYYRNSVIDDVIMRFMDVIFPFPSLVLAIALLGVVGVGTTEYTLPLLGNLSVPNLAKVIIVISIVYIPRFARVMRGAVLKEVEEDYVDALKALGASDSRIILKDIVINTIPSVIVQATLYMGTAILISAGLSFLGLGIQPPTASLGVMLSSSRNYIYSGEWWFSVFPGVMIMITILGFNLLGDGLRDALDPRYQGNE